jgi:hypothetical protein
MDAYMTCIYKQNNKWFQQSTYMHIIYTLHHYKVIIGTKHSSNCITLQKHHSQIAK